MPSRVRDAQALGLAALREATADVSAVRGHRGGQADKRRTIPAGRSGNRQDHRFVAHDLAGHAQIQPARGAGRHAKYVQASELQAGRTIEL